MNAPCHYQLPLDTRIYNFCTYKARHYENLMLSAIRVSREASRVCQRSPIHTCMYIRASRCYDTLLLEHFSSAFVSNSSLWCWSCHGSLDVPLLFEPV